MVARRFLFPVGVPVPWSSDRINCAFFVPCCCHSPRHCARRGLIAVAVVIVAAAATFAAAVGIAAADTPAGSAVADTLVITAETVASNPAVVYAAAVYETVIAILAGIDLVKLPQKRQKSSAGS